MALLPPHFGHQLTLKLVLLPLLLLNFSVYGVLLGLSSWAYNETALANNVTSDLVKVSLAAGVVGMASVLSGLLYALKWTPETKSSAFATSLISLSLSLLLLGMASKHIEAGSVGNKRLKALESFGIIVGGVQLVYTLLVHGLFGEDELYGYTTAPAAAPAEEAGAPKEAAAEAAPPPPEEVPVVVEK